MSDNAFKKQCINHNIPYLEYKVKYKRSDTFTL